jgi:Na+/H+-translocating membrane pyrophosphatase
VVVIAGMGADLFGSYVANSFSSDGSGNYVIKDMEIFKMLLAE